MGAPIGNQFWKIRSKHGRDHIIKDPVKLWESAEQYFKWCEDHPLIEVDYRGKDSTRIELEHPRPFTKQGLTLFCGMARWEDLVKLKDVSKDFAEIITRIEYTIYEQKFSGAASGFYNPVIISRDLGLTEKSNITHEGGIAISIDKDDSGL